MTLATTQLEDAGDPRFPSLLAIYAQSLPKREQKKRTEIEALVARPDYLVLAVEDDRRVVGFAIVQISPTAPIALLEYMATDPTRRSSGIGAVLFADIVHRVGNRTILVEADSERQSDARDLDQRLRRKSFYRRLGCRQLDGLAYDLPLPGEGKPPLMDLLLFRDPMPNAVPTETVQLWLQAIYSEVYGQSPDDSRIARMLEPFHQAEICVR
jgi:GNAT superfamily N-acetyltransferase